MTEENTHSNTSSADAKELCDNLNTFYARFDSKDNYSSLIDELNTVCDNDNCIDISEHEVRLLFKELNSRKSPGPDNISPLLLKCCHNELSGVYQHLFQLSINSGIPCMWKTAAYVWSVFIDFSSAFNTLKPGIVINKLRTLMYHQYYVSLF